MDLTETEAKTKWRPFSHTAAFTDRGQLMAVTTNRNPLAEAAAQRTGDDDRDMRHPLDEIAWSIGREEMEAVDK